MDVEPVDVTGSSFRGAPLNENGLAGTYENVRGSASRSTGRPPTKGRGPSRGVPTFFDLSDMAASQSGLRSEEHTSELQSQSNLVCRLLLEKKKKKNQM